MKNAAMRRRSRYFEGGGVADNRCAAMASLSGVNSNVRAVASRNDALIRQLAVRRRQEPPSFQNSSRLWRESSAAVVL